MASDSAPSPLFLRLTSIWAHLALRSDVDDIVLELLGQFSLEKVYAGTGLGDRHAYQQVVKTLLSQLGVIFYLQRLTLPAENSHVGWYLGFLVSWELALRTVELVLQAINEGRESLWDDRVLRDRYLAEFLLSALRVLSLHPKAAANQRVRERRERYCRLHRSLEQVFDSYPGPKSFLLQVCKEVTNRLQTDPDALGLPSKMRYEVPNLTSELYPLPDCLSPQYISELAPPGDLSIDWLPQFLALRDISHFVVGASVQYAANRESRDARLRSSSGRSRNAVLQALDNLRIPSSLSKVEMVAAFSATFRIILPDTPGFSRQLLVGSGAHDEHDEHDLDSLDSLCVRLKQRQIIHRMSDRETMINVSQVVRNILLQDDPGGQSATPRPSLYALNCSKCHLVGGSQLASAGVELSSERTAGAETTLPVHSQCPCCEEPVSLAREASLVRRAWELLRPLEPDADTINVERHLPTNFQLAPPKTEGGLPVASYSSNIASTTEQRPLVRNVPTIESSASPSLSHLVSPLSPRVPGVLRPSLSYPIKDLAGDNHPEQGRGDGEKPPDLAYLRVEPSPLPDPSNSTQYRGSASGPEVSPVISPTDIVPTGSSRTMPFLNAPPEKGRSKWRLKFPGTRKPSVGTSADSSSLSSTAIEAQRLEEISLAALCGLSKTGSRGKGPKNIHVELSRSSSLALFWTQQTIQVWEVGVSPPTMTRSILTESTCVLATIAKLHLAYVIGNRDQRLTLRIVNLLQPATPAAEYRISSSLWCKSIAIDKEENYVVLGFENATVRFFKTASSMEQPREDRLHSLYHTDCRGCPPVDTLSFSNDGLVLLASTRSAKSGVIQLYAWKFPFLTFQEVPSCRYPVPLHESEDNGVSSAIFRAGKHGEDNLVCITTWTQSGTPVLIQPEDGHKSEIRTDPAGKQNKVGNRIQCAEFSPSGREIAMVNDKGYLYHVSSLNSNVMDVRKVATSRELTARSDSYAMAFMMLSDEENIVLAWADAPKATGWVKKIPTSRGNFSIPPTPGVSHENPYMDSRLAISRGSTKHLAELEGEDGVAELDARETAYSTQRKEGINRDKNRAI